MEENKDYCLEEQVLETRIINNQMTNKSKRRFFATGQWYKIALTLILWSVLQEIVMASTDLVDNIFVNHINNLHIKGLDTLLDDILNSGWSSLTKDQLQAAGIHSLYYGEGMNYSGGQIAVNGIVASNQLFIIMMAMVSGFCYGAGIFSAQYFGAGEYQKLKQVTALKLYVTLSITFVFMLFALPGITEHLIGFTTKPGQVIKPIGELTSASTSEEINAYFKYFQNEAAKLSTNQGEMYYRIVGPSYLLFAINQTTISSLRETGRPFYSFFLAFISLGCNIPANLFLTSPTFLGNFMGFGVRGCAIGTVLSRILQTSFVFGLCYLQKFEFIPHFKSFKVQTSILKRTLNKSMPILLNELLFAFGQVIQVKLKSIYSVEALTANAIYETTLMAFFSPMYHGINAGISVLVGNQLGSNEFEKAQYNAKHLLVLSASIGVLFMGIFSGMAFVIPKVIFPNTLPRALSISQWMIFIYAMIYPFIIFNSCCYSLLRAGGDVVSAFAMDSLFNWIVQIPILTTLILLNQNEILVLDIVWIHLIACICDVIKVIPATILYKRKRWVKNLVVENIKEEQNDPEIELE